MIRSDLCDYSDAYKEWVLCLAKWCARSKIICLLWLIVYTNYSKFCKGKFKKQHCVYCDFNDISIIYFNSIMTVLQVRNHQIIIYSKVLEKKLILVHHPSTYKMPWYIPVNGTITNGKGVAHEEQMKEIKE